MLATESGIVTLVRPLQPENADAPILVTESGIVTLVSALHPKKVSLMLVTPLEITAFVITLYDDENTDNNLEEHTL
jgi:hypothetical protein